MAIVEDNLVQVKYSFFTGKRKNIPSQKNGLSIQEFRSN